MSKWSDFVSRTGWHRVLAALGLGLGVLLLSLHHYGADWTQGHGVEGLGLGLLLLACGVLAGLWRGARLRDAADAALRESEARFRTLVEQSGAGVVIVQDGRVAYANPRAAEIAGRTAAQLQGRPLADFIAPEQRERLAAGIDELVRGSDRSGVQYDVVRADGTRRCIEVQGNGALLQGREALIAVVQDVTERALAESRRRESARLLQAVEDSVPTAIVVLDTAGRVIALNDAWRRLAQQHADAAVLAAVAEGADFLALAGPALGDAAAGRADVQAGVRRVLAGQAAAHGADVACRVGGGLAHFTLSVTPLRTESGGAVLIWTDVSALRRAELAVQASAAHYRSMVTSLSEGVVIFDDRAQALGCNPAAEHLLGLTQAQMSASRRAVESWQVLRPDGSRMPPQELPLGRLYASGQAQHGCVLGYVHPEGRTVWLQVNAVPVHDDSGRTLVGGVVSFVDITAQRLAADALARHQQELEARVAGRTAELEHALAALRESEAFMRTVTDNLPTLIACWTPDRRLRFANRAYLEWLGLRESDALGRTLAEIVGAEFVAEHDGEIRRALAGETVRGRLVRRSVDGREGHFWTQRLPCVHDGVPNGWFFFAFDVTENTLAARRLADANTALAAAEKRIRLIADSVPGRLSYWDRDARCRFVNRFFCEWHGVAPDQVLGRTLAEVVGPALLAQVQPRVQAALRGEPQAFERTDAPRGGEPASAWVQYVPDLRDGEVHGFIALSTDNTETRRTERQLRELNDALTLSRDRAEQANQAKSAFLANMSHEIRTPMNAIIGITHLLARELETASQRARLAKIADAARHLLELINDVLDLSKIEAGKFGLAAVDFAPGEMVARTVALVADKAREKGLEIDVRVDALPARLRGDPTRLSQALLNLLSNAVKFTEHGRIALHAFVEAGPAAGCRVRFEVADTGVGIAPDKLAQVFNAFEQADTSTTRRHGGTGLGLAITRRLAEMMGGAAGADSTPGVGSRFWFSALLAPAEAAPVPDGQAPLAGRRGLLVDDAPETRLAIGALMAGLGLRTDSVGGAAAALAMAERAALDGVPYDVVVLDWQMPDMDGLELARRLRQDAGRDSALVLVSARQVAELEDLAAGAGIDRVLAKPVTEAALHDCLAEVLVDTWPEVQRRRPAAAEDATETALRRRCGGQRVLLAEDNLVNQEVAVELLQAVGLAVDVAADGAAAVRMAGERDYALVLMDMQMPVLDGMAATRALRALPGRAQWPVLALTANAFAEDRRACLAAGMNDHLVKPVDPQALYAALLRWLPAGAAAAPPPPPATPGGAAIARVGGVPGFDAEGGLRLSGLRPELYLAVLRRFVSVYAGGLPALREAAAGAPPVELARLAHSVRGACATVGAHRVQQRAEAVEAMGRGDAPRAELAAAALALEAELAALAAALRARLDA